MQLNSSKRILLVGATGYVGRKLVHLLLSNTDATLILSGRSSVKLDELRSSLPMHDQSDRIQLLELDATALNLASVPEFDLLVNATANGRHNTSLIEICLEHRADWIDMQTTNELLKPQADLLAEIKRAGCCFVIQAGFHPGLPAALVPYSDFSSLCFTKTPMF